MWRGGEVDSGAARDEMVLSRWGGGQGMECNNGGQRFQQRDGDGDVAAGKAFGVLTREHVGKQQNEAELRIHQVVFPLWFLSHNGNTTWCILSSVVFSTHRASVRGSPSGTTRWAVLRCRSWATGANATAARRARLARRGRECTPRAAFMVRRDPMAELSGHV